MSDALRPDEKSYFCKIIKLLNQLHTRSFSLNTFQMNASALIEALLEVFCFSASAHLTLYAKRNIDGNNRRGI